VELELVFGQRDGDGRVRLQVLDLHEDVFFDRGVEEGFAG